MKILGFTAFHANLLRHETRQYGNNTAQSLRLSLLVASTMVMPQAVESSVINGEKLAAVYFARDRGFGTGRDEERGARGIP